MLNNKLTLEGGYPTLIVKQSVSNRNTQLYSGIQEIPKEDFNLYIVDFDYVDYLNNEMVKSCIVINHTIEFKTRASDFSFYYDSLGVDYFCFKTSNGKNYRFSKKYFNIRYMSQFGFKFEDADSIIKKSDSDSLIIIRGDSTYYFNIPK